jgi:hypothetical protein
MTQRSTVPHSCKSCGKSTRQVCKLYARNVPPGSVAERVSNAKRGNRRGNETSFIKLKPGIHAGFQASLERFHTKTNEIKGLQRKL